MKIQYSDNKYILFFGIPGSGKGTIINQLVKKYSQIVHLAPGKMFRKAQKENSEFYKEHVKPWLNKGILIPSEITNAMMGKELLKYKNNSIVIFDGYPRTMEQMSYLENKIHSIRAKQSLAQIDLVINLIIDKIIAKKRITNRRICSFCGTTYKKGDDKTIKSCFVCKNKLNLILRNDDQPEVYEKRYQIHLDLIQPVIDKYREIFHEFFVDFQINEVESRSAELTRIETELAKKGIKLKL